MTTEVRTQTIVQPGGLVEVRSDELPEGATVNVIVLIETPKSEDTRQRKLLDFIGAAKGSFSSVAEVDAYIREERDLWDN